MVGASHELAEEAESDVKETAKPNATATGWDSIAKSRGDFLLVSYSYTYNYNTRMELPRSGSEMVLQ